MRKILSLILILGIITGLSSLKILGATETINYDLQFINNKKWDINNGGYVTDTNYMATTRHRIVENDITLNNLNFHHILFWSDNLYLGYYNTTAGGYENSKYLGDTGVNVTVPTNATWFSLTAYKLAPNELPQTIFNGDSLEDVFTVDYKTTPISTLNNKTLKEVFEVGQLLLLNPNFNNTSNTFTVNVTNVSVTSGIITFTATAQYGSISKAVALTLNNYMYLVSSIKTTSSLVGLSPQTLGTGIKYHSGSNSFETLSLKYQITSTANNTFRIIDTRTSNFDPIYSDYIYLYNMTSLGISSLTVTQMDYWFSQYLSTAINLQAFNEYNSVTFTQTQLDEYLATYTDNLVWADGISMLIFYSMEASYDREEVIPDERNFLERLSDWFDDFGLGAFPKIVISLVVFIAVAVIMHLFKVSMLGILIIEFVFFVMLVVFGFFPVWIVIVVAIVLLFLIIMALAGGL